MEVELIVGQRQDKESNKAVIACNDWLRLGIGRSTGALLEGYRERSKFQVSFAPPTTSTTTLYSWSSDFKWADRAEIYDAGEEDIRNQERTTALSRGLALDHKRVKKLKKLALFLEGQIYEQDEHGNFYNVWLADVKQIGSGKDTERVDIVRFNGALISEFRNTLDDLAKETGGRKQALALETDKPLAILITRMNMDEI